MIFLHKKGMRFRLHWYYRFLFLFFAEMLHQDFTIQLQLLFSQFVLSLQLQYSFYSDSSINFMQKEMDLQIDVDEDLKNAKLQFYKLHYPVKRKLSTSRKTQKVRSKSMVSVLNTLDNQQSLQYPSINQNNKKPRQFSPQKQKILKKFKQANPQQSKITFKKILSCESDNTKLSQNILKLPIKSLKDLQQFSHNNITLRNSLERAKQQKIKINKLILSHKQTQQIKLDYLEAKRKDVVDQIDKQIRSTYEKYFKKQYEIKYGLRGFSQFEKSIGGVIGKLSEMIFM